MLLRSSTNLANVSRANDIYGTLNWVNISPPLYFKGSVQKFGLILWSRRNMSMKICGQRKNMVACGKVHVTLHKPIIQSIYVIVHFTSVNVLHLWDGCRVLIMITVATRTRRLPTWIYGFHSNCNTYRPHLSM